jgi:hypothetical protein
MSKSEKNMLFGGPDNPFDAGLAHVFLQSRIFDQAKGFCVSSQKAAHVVIAGFFNLRF